MENRPVAGTNEYGCKDVMERLCGYTDGELSKEESAACEKHIAVCPECAREYKELKELIAAVGETAAEPPETLYNDIMAAVSAEKNASRRPRRVLVSLLRYAAPAAAAVLLLICIPFALRKPVTDGTGILPRGAAYSDDNTGNQDTATANEPSLTCAALQPESTGTSQNVPQSGAVADATEAPDSVASPTSDSSAQYSSVSTAITSTQAMIPSESHNPEKDGKISVFILSGADYDRLKKEYSGQLESENDGVCIYKISDALLDELSLVGVSSDELSASAFSEKLSALPDGKYVAVTAEP